MGYVVGIGRMEGRSVQELSSTVPALRYNSFFWGFSNGELKRTSKMDEDKLEANSNSDICVTVLNVDRLREASRAIAEGETISGIYKWSIATLITWALAASVFSVMEWQTISTLRKYNPQIISNQQEIIKNQQVLLNAIKK